MASTGIVPEDELEEGTGDADLPSSTGEGVIPVGIVPPLMELCPEELPVLEFDPVLVSGGGWGCTNAGGEDTVAETRDPITFSMLAGCVAERP